MDLVVMVVVSACCKVVDIAGKIVDMAVVVTVDYWAGYWVIAFFLS